jgi:hypothetical protein
MSGLMLAISETVCIDAPAVDVWQALSALESIHLWVEPIRHSYCESRATRGKDAVRVCELAGNVTVKETIVEWNEGTSFAYTGEGAPLAQWALNRWTIEAKGAQTLVTTSAEVVLKGGVFGRALEPLFAMIARRMGIRSLAGLKFYVEKSRPFEGRASKLLPIPIAC